MGGDGEVYHVNAEMNFQRDHVESVVHPNECAEQPDGAFDGSH